MSEREPENEQLSSAAIRMMAFGVFEASPMDQHTFSRAAAQNLEGLFQDVSPKLDMEALVMAEFDAHGWLLKIERGSTRGKQFILLGKLDKRGTFITRELIGRGSFQECCNAAVNYLDRGDRVRPRGFTSTATEGETE